MNLRKMIFWNRPTSSAPLAQVSLVDAPRPMEPTPQDAISNVVQLPDRTPLSEPAGLDAALASPELTSPVGNQPAGLMDTPELKAFFADNYFGLGRHNGSNYRTQEALTQGMQSLVSRFQNTLAQLVEQRQAKVDRLRNTQLQTEGLCATTTAQLDMACKRIERDMAVLRDQVEQASNSKGWILEALNRYQIGFGKGLREAVDFELLGN